MAVQESVHKALAQCIQDPTHVFACDKEIFTVAENYAPAVEALAKLFASESQR